MRRPARTVLSATVSVLALVGFALSAVPASATPGAGPVQRAEKRVCSVPSAGTAGCEAHVVTDARTGKPAATTGYAAGYTPAQLTSVYGPFGTSTPTVAVVDAYANPNAAADLAAYRTQFGLGAGNLTQVNQSGGSIATVAGNVSWGQEENLDLQMVSALAPGSSILYVGANSASFSDLAAAVTTAKNLGAKVVSNSYGGSEFNGETNWTNWNIPGVAVTVAAGDSGYGVEFPAASAGVIAVGGTSLKLTSAGTRSSETAWSGTGSGCSAYVSKPTWQKDTGCTHRTVTDVAAVADPNTGVAVYDSYGSTGGANWYVFGGTSVAAPIIGAIYARDGVPATGYAAASLYANASGLYDVTSGSNGSCTSRHKTAAAYLCTAMTGYDGPTGNGAPQGLTLPF
jgi:subtilase family serine protease